MCRFANIRQPRASIAPQLSIIAAALLALLIALA
jgi:hypothetical protein